MNQKVKDHVFFVRSVTCATVYNKDHFFGTHTERKRLSVKNRGDRWVGEAGSERGNEGPLGGRRRMADDELRHVDCVSSGDKGAGQPPWGPEFFAFWHPK